MAETLCDDRPLAFDDLAAWFAEGAKPVEQEEPAAGDQQQKFGSAWLARRDHARVCLSVTIDTLGAPANFRVGDSRPSTGHAGSFANRPAPLRMTWVGVIIRFMKARRDAGERGPRC